MSNEGISRWRLVGDALIQEIDQGVLGPGDRLPAELDLAERFGVARQTVRRALSHLRSEGLIDVQLGRGTFVSEKVFEYRIGARKSFEENLLDSAMSPSRRLLELGRVEATGGVAGNLEIGAGDPVLLALTLNLADEVPVVLGRVYFALARHPGVEAPLRAAFEAQRSFSLADLLAEAGVGPLRRSFIRLKSRLPLAEETARLALPAGETIVETSSVTVDGAGKRVYHSVMAYRGSRVEFYIGAEAFGG